jgi:exopolyphosphatase/guanosine-5'-triphosphate,3'-diphosphate pyrophosphatase
MLLGRCMVETVLHSRSKVTARGSRWRLSGSDGISRHERRVAVIAVKLFDLLAAQHELGRKYRHLLHVAALVHDAGRVFGAKGHEHSGAAMVLADRLLPLTLPQRRAIAYLVRYHRGTIPSEIGEQQILLSCDPHEKLRLVLGFLRAADGLDSRRLRARAIVIKRKSRKLRITCLVADKVAKARRRLGGANKLELLEREMGLRVRLRIKRAAQSA